MRMPGQQITRMSGRSSYLRVQTAIQSISEDAPFVPSWLTYWDQWHGFDGTLTRDFRRQSAMGVDILLPQ